MEKTIALILLAFALGVLASPTIVCIYQTVDGVEDAAKAAIISTTGFLIIAIVFVLIATGVM